MKPFKFFETQQKPNQLGWSFENQMLVSLLTHCKRTNVPYEGAYHIYNNENHIAFLMKIVSSVQHIDYWLFHYEIKNLTTNTTQLDNIRVTNSVIRDLLYVERV
jgi:hypothetical protein